MSKDGKLLKGILLGTLIGGALGVLFAPKSGKETRKEIKDKAEETKVKGEKMYKEYSTKMKAEKDRMKDKMKRAETEFKK
ncbi:YtxH domain-containing protein [Patescibacteria group bacterium]